MTQEKILGYSSKAQDRQLLEWYTKIAYGQLKLPRFQRYEAWDRNRISSFMTTIIYNLPIGITLLLEVGESEKFVSRYIDTLDTLENNRVTEHLLDGQQRLTAFWKLMHNNYENETYYIYIPEYDIHNDNKEKDEMHIYCQPRWIRNNKKYPIWADDTEICFNRGLIPTNLLKPIDISNDIENWISEAISKYKPEKNDDDDYNTKIENYYNFKNNLFNKITELRERIKVYNLPYLMLPHQTHEITALQVFINMNTNSKPLSIYDIIVAEVEQVKGVSLHDLHDDLIERCPDISNYFDTERLILLVAALMQDKIANNRGMTEMNKEFIVDNFEKIESGIIRMVNFLQSQKIFDSQRLPTNAVLAPISALYTYIPESGDMLGRAEIILKEYLWSSFFTDRYENSSASRAYVDYIALKNIILNNKNDKNDVPVLNRSLYPITEIEELLTLGWPKRENIRARAILAVTTYLGCIDFASGQNTSKENIFNKEYHHIFPDALLKEANISSFLALNCALIDKETNRNIGRQDPKTYLSNRYDFLKNICKWNTQDIINKRLNSHLIPIQELKTSGYNEMDQNTKIEKIKKDFNNFILKRAKLIHKSACELAEGKDISPIDII